jgi:DNA-binding NarL/FixJ family response regulator
LTREEWRELAAELDLSPQQAKIVEFILRGMQDKEIASTMGISFSTVRTHIARIFLRVGVRERLALVLHVFSVFAARRRQ